MIAIDVELLTGRYVATSFNKWGTPEWPPHPARLFSALVATATEHEDMTKASQRALEWLEAQESPQIVASAAAARVVLTMYVPKNDTRVMGECSAQEQKVEAAVALLKQAEESGDAKAAERARNAIDRAAQKLDEQIAKSIAVESGFNASAVRDARQMIPEHRGRLPKQLPSVTPDEPRVRYFWPNATPDASTAEALSGLASRLVRLGHSSTLISCRVTVNDGSTPDEDTRSRKTWMPAADGKERIRTVTGGQLNRLGRAYERHQGVDPRVLPAKHESYRTPGVAVRREPARSVFGEWLVLREVASENNRRLGLPMTRTEDITRALRGALLHHGADPPPAVLSGHEANGSPIQRPHVSFVVLPDVGSRYAGGAILGAAVVLPQEILAEERRMVLRAIGEWERSGLRLILGRAGVMQLERIVDLDPRSTLDPATWSRPSRRWASVTAVALDENPGDLSSQDPKTAADAAARAEEIVARSCERIGLPRPAWVQIMRRSLFDAAPAAVKFMPFPRLGKGPRRVCVHVEILFQEPVAGPVLIGAGRYFGLGLCRPMQEGW